MTKILLIFFVVVSWYIAGMVHSFELMLYAVSLTVFMFAMYFVTQIYKKKVSFSFDSDYTGIVKEGSCPVKININNSSVLPISKIRLDIEVKYGFGGNADKKKYTYKKEHTLKYKVYGSCHRKKDFIKFMLKMPYTGPACVYIRCAYLYDYTGAFRRKVKLGNYMNVAVLPYIDDGSVRLEYLSSESDTMQELSVNIAGNAVDDIRQIREYQTGDSYRHIHWNLSAKTGSLLVKEFSQKTDIEINVVARAFADALSDYKRMGDFYDKLINEAIGLISDKSIINIVWYDYEYDIFVKHHVKNMKDCEDVLYDLFLYHEKCRVNNKKTGIDKELPLIYKNTNTIEINTELEVVVNGNMKEQIKD